MASKILGLEQPTFFMVVIIIVVLLLLGFFTFQTFAEVKANKRLAAGAGFGFDMGLPQEKMFSIQGENVVPGVTAVTYQGAGQG